MKHTLGKNLKVGDTIKVWWSSFNGQKTNEDKITKLETYRGPLHIWPEGAKIAYFQFNSIVGMTIDNNSDYEVV